MDLTSDQTTNAGDLSWKMRQNISGGEIENEDDWCTIHMHSSVVWRHTPVCPVYLHLS